MQVGTVESLKQIHQYLFEDIYEFVGKIRKVNIAKENLAMCWILFLKINIIFRGSILSQASPLFQITGTVRSSSELPSVH